MEQNQPMTHNLPPAQPERKRKRTRGGRKKNKNKNKQPVEIVPTKKLKIKVLQKLSQVVKGLKSYLIQKNIKHVQKTTSKSRNQPDQENEEENNIIDPVQTTDTSEVGPEQLAVENGLQDEETELQQPERAETKLGKLENKLDSLRTLNGKSFRLCALTIARFDLAIKF
jgi:hypothetical protein